MLSHRYGHRYYIGFRGSISVVFSSVWICLTWMILSLPLGAQVSNAPKVLSTTYLLKNCFIVPSPGKLLKNQNILIKDGLIQEVGAEFRTPFDAIVVQADSLYVYAGFIDGYSHTGIARPDKKDNSKKETNDHPYHMMGITPHMSAQNFFRSDDKGVAENRRAGVTMAHVVPRGGMLSGKTDVILLGQKHAESMTVKAGFAQHFQLVPASGTFPSTFIGVLSQFQDVFQNAALAGKHTEMYKENPEGMVRPDYHNALIELFPTTTRDMPYIVPASHTRDIFRILDLQKKLKFKLILANVKQGWQVVDDLKDAGHGVLLSLELPEIKSGNRDSLVRDSSSWVNDEQLFYTKKDSILLMYHRQAHLFEKAGIEFGFSFVDVKADKISDHIRSMIKHGLTPEGALKSLTTYPARLFGLEKLVGSVEKGKLAHLVVFNKPFHEDEAQLKYVFLDGDMYKYDQKEKKQKESYSVKKYLGSWSYSIDIPGDPRKGMMDIYNENNVYHVRMTGDDGSYAAVSKDMVLEGKLMSFSMVINMGQDIRLDYRLNMEKESFKGQVDIENIGTYSISGTKVSTPD